MGTLKPSKLNEIPASDGTDAQLLHQLTVDLLKQEETGLLYKKITDAAAAVMHAQHASIQLYYPDTINHGRLRLLASSGFNAEAEKYWEWVDYTTGSSCGAALRAEKQVIITNFETCDFMRETPTLPIFLNAGIYAAQSTPLYASDGGLLGMISTHWDYPHQPPGHRLELQDVFVREVGYLLERSNTAEQSMTADKGSWKLGATSADYTFRLSADGDELFILDGSKHGLKSERPLRHWLERFIPGADHAEIMAEIAHARLYKSAFQLEHPIVTADYLSRWYSSHIIPIVTDGEIVQWLGASIDITEIKLRLSRPAGQA